MLVHCGEERSRVITRPRRRKQQHPRYDLAGLLFDDLLSCNLHWQIRSENLSRRGNARQSCLNRSDTSGNAKRVDIKHIASTGS
ncbi:hypothetical protein I7I48_06224 [Histoplasma ohiense]|nr:hypothetical protein I7I48_06224 [Histoplasma ohiense (nom. inval.)]